MLDTVLVAHRRIALELIELGGVAAAEPLRALGELQSAAIDSACPSRESAIGASPDPFELPGWGILSAFEATGRMLRLVATGSAIIASSAGRINDTLARSGAAIQEALSARVSRIAPSPPGR